jgi:hypothetical protein
VYIRGGVCSTGVDEALFGDIAPAIRFAAEEVRIAINTRRKA